MTPEINASCEDCSTKCRGKVLCITIDCTVSKAPLGCPPQATLCPSCDSFWGSMNQPALRIPTASVDSDHQAAVAREAQVIPVNTANHGADGGRATRRYVEVGYAPEPAALSCRCGLPAALKSVTKEGQNKGRKFFCCSRSQNDSSNCKFFQFCDEEEAGRPVRASSLPIYDAVCSRCMKRGHFARSCPEKSR